MDHAITSNFDIAILGGGILGCATAYFLLKESPGLSVCVIEPDPTYEFASTLRASGGCRVQFTCPENIAMSLYSIGFIKAFEQTMASNGRPAPVDWVEGGYLFIVPPDNVANLERNVKRQRAEGCGGRSAHAAGAQGQVSVDEMSTTWVRERTPRTTGGAIRTDCCGAFAARRSSWVRSM